MMKISLLAGLLVSFTVHAEVRCERVKREVRSFSGTSIVRMVNVSQNNEVIYSEEFDENINARNQAADACATAVAQAQQNCQTFLISESYGHYEGDGLGRVYVKGEKAHVGAKDLATNQTYSSEAACEYRYARLGIKAIDRVKSQEALRSKAMHNWLNK